jgi:Zn-dependent protease with chaperone function
MAYAVATARRREDIHMPASVCSVGLLAVVVALLGACASAEVRTARPEERNRVTEALTPLVNAAYGAEAARCRVASGVLEADTLDAWVRAESETACQLSVVVTTRAVDTLTPRALQLLLAHELGHAWSRHPVGRARRGEIHGSRTDSGHRTTLTTGGQQFSPDEEAAADAAAARMLTRAWRGSNVGCLGLADFYEDIAKDRKPWGPWLSRHPFPERRVDAVVRACEDEQRQRG